MSFVVKQGFLLSLILIPHKRIRCDPLLGAGLSQGDCQEGGGQVICRETDIRSILEDSPILSFFFCFSLLMLCVCCKVRD